MRGCVNVWLKRFKFYQGNIPALLPVAECWQHLLTPVTDLSERKGINERHLSLAAGLFLNHLQGAKHVFRRV